MDEFEGCWEDLQDPRTGNAALHDFHALLMIALCAVLCRGQSAVDTALFAREKEAYLQGFLTLEEGLPSHDTFSRLFRLLDPEQFRAAFQKFMARFRAGLEGVIALDGNVLRRTFDKAAKRSALHMVSAWGCEQRLVLAQVATDEKTNEIAPVPKLLKLRSLKGTIVTTDALKCQRAIAQQIIDQGGGYCLALKDNQPTLAADVKLCFDHPAAMTVSAAPTVDADHGRIETRTATVSTDVDEVRKIHGWPGLQAIGKLHRTREAAGKITRRDRLPRDQRAALAGALWRGRSRPLGRRESAPLAPGRDDERRSGPNPQGQRPYNLAILRHMAVNLMQKDTEKGSLRGKFKQAAWNETYLTSLRAMI